MTTAERWHKLKTLFADAVALPPADREAWMRAHCEDADLATELRSLLAAHDAPHELLGDDTPLAPLPVPADDRLPDGYRIGPYCITAHLGEGGMGSVYAATRADGMYAHAVAIKIVRGGVGTADILRRFASERQLLAALTHPNIAMLLDGGTADDGRPYFVMEYIQGQPIDAYCEARQLPLRDRLTLFTRVCAAAAYAHRHLIIHRDLKPDNILVRDDGEVKLLDFGIAKILDPDAAGEATVTGVHPMTLRYASPEQIRGHALSTATDIYSLGVVLYQLLTGRLPYGGDQARMDLERAICEQDPEPPSRTGPGVPVDVDAIVLMALRKEPERRYQSVEQLTDDIERFLAGAPVQARPDTWRYRTRKFIARNRVASVAAVVAGVAVLAGLVATTRSERAAVDAAARAEAEVVRAQRMNQFLTNILALPDASWYSPGARGEADMTVVELLRRAGERIDAELGEHPDLAADMFHTLGNTLRARGRCEEARAHFARALDLRRATFEPPHPKVSESLYFLGAATGCLKRIQEARGLFEQAAAMERQLPQPTANLPFLLLDLSGVLSTLMDLDEAERVALEAHAEFARQFGPADPRTAFPLGVLGDVYFSFGDYDRARAQYDEALAITRANPSLLDLGPPLRRLAVVELRQRRFEAAEPLLREAMAWAIAHNDSEREIPQLHIDLAEVHLGLGRTAAAAQAVAVGLDMLRAAGNRSDPRLLGAVLQAAEIATVVQPSAVDAYLIEAVDLTRDATTTLPCMLAQVQHVRDRWRFRQGEISRADLRQAVEAIRAQCGGRLFFYREAQAAFAALTGEPVS